jgi:hypothetical protein
MLQESGFRLPVSVRFPVVLDGPVWQYLHWTEQNRKWRIYYYVSDLRDVDPDSDRPYENAYPVEEWRPLIETPVEVRLRSVEPLAELIREIDSRIPDRLALPRQLLLFK